MSNIPGDNSTLNIRLLFEEIDEKHYPPSPLWRCINIIGGTFLRFLFVKVDAFRIELVVSNQSRGFPALC
jgi:hypothetical protein